MDDIKVLLKEDIKDGLKRCGVKKGQNILVHTSLKSFGFVVGGAETIICSLLETVGEDGTIMMPSQTWKNLDPEIGVHWEVPEKYYDMIRENWPAYNKDITPAIGMGCVAELFAKWPGRKRSDHPARSFAAVGKNAQYLTENHDIKNIFGEGSPLSKLYDLDGYVLLLGVGYNKNTSFHLAETRAEYKNKHESTQHSAVLVDGKRKWISYDTLEVDDSDFIEMGEAFEKEYDVKKVKIGNCDARLIRQRDVVDFAVKYIEKTRI